MTLVEKQIADVLSARLEALNLDSVHVMSTLAATASDARNVEEIADAAVVTVAVPPRVYDTAQIPTATVSPTITVNAREDADATGALILAVYDAVMTLLQSWQNDLDAACAAFTTANFTPAGFRLDGGAGPEFDVSTARWTLSLAFTIRGVIN